MTFPGDAPLPDYRANRLVGLAAIGLAIGFNLPFIHLARLHDYPDILRRPAAEALDRFAAGGTEIILTWYAFTLAALALAPLAVALSITADRLRHRPALAISAALFGALAGLTQAIGLSRWVFVVPSLARMHAGPALASASEQAFEILNLYGGVAIGEHLGQLLTALFALCLGMLQWSEGTRLTALFGFATAASIAFGTGEGLSLALGLKADIFASGTSLGFLGLTFWLIASGIASVREDRPAPRLV